MLAVVTPALGSVSFERMGIVENFGFTVKLNNIEAEVELCLILNPKRGDFFQQSDRARPVLVRMRAISRRYLGRKRAMLALVAVVLARLTLTR